MKLIILLAVATLARCDKLDRTYLPPVHAQSSGGSGNFLQTPNFSSQPEASGFGQNGNGFTQNGREYGQAGNDLVQGGNDFAQGGNGFAQGGNGFAQAGNGFSQNENDFAQNGNDFAQSGNDFTQNQNDFAQNGNGFAQNDASNFQRAERPRAAFERTASILRQDSQNDGETYSYSFETENGISAEESGVATNGVEAQGGFSYIGDDGQVYSIRYTADQNGFVPQGDHLPTPPPIPEEILKALEQNARDEANGIFDDGSFQEGKYADSEAEGNQNYSGNQNYNAGSQNNAGNQNFGGNFNDNPFARDDDTIITNSAAADNAYLPPFADQSPALNQRPKTLNRVAQNGNLRQIAAVTNNYLPPLGNQASVSGSQRPDISNQRPQNGNQRQNTDVTNSYLPPFGNQAPTTRNQRPDISNQRQQNGNQKQKQTNSYLPPLDNQRAVVRNQIPSAGIQRQTIANAAYLPPLDNQRANVRGGPQLDQKNSAGPQNSFGSNDVTNAYLPPNQSRRPASFNARASAQKSSNGGFASTASNGFGQRNVQRRPSYNARDGYQY